MELFGVQGEYGDTVEVCPRCGEALAPVPVAGASGGVPPAAVYERAGAVTNAALVPLAKSLLQAEGIAYVTRNEYTQEMLGWGSFGTGFNAVIGAIELWVDAHRLEEAVEILGDLERPSTLVLDDPLEEDAP